MPLTPIASLCAVSLVCIGIVTKCFCYCCRGPPSEHDVYPVTKPARPLRTLKSYQSISNERTTI